MDALNKAITALRTQTNLANAIGVKPQVVHNWVVRGNVPADYCPTIEKVTSGAVKCEELRPDVDWAYLRGTAVSDQNEAA